MLDFGIKINALWELLIIHDSVIGWGGGGFVHVEQLAVYSFLSSKQKSPILSFIFLLAKWAFVARSHTTRTMFTSDLVDLSKTVWPGE